MRFGFLGPMAVWTDDGRQVPIPGAKVRVLLADLLVNAGQPVSADRLIDDIWGERPPGNRSGTLSAKVSALRHALEMAEAGARSLIVSPPPGYRLESTAIDVAVFEDLTDRARRSEDPGTRAALLTEALALCRGEVLADFRDYRFAETAVARLEEQVIVAREELAEARLVLGEHAALTGELAPLVLVHPLRERLRGAYIHALYGSGRQQEALRQYEQLRVRLAEDHGLDPSPRLVELQRAILAQDPALSAAPTEGPIVSRMSNLPVPGTELIGRDLELARITARVGEARLVTLTGPGGVGKSRLALSVAHRLSGDFPGGTWLLELSGHDSASLDDLIDAVLGVLGIREAANPAAQLSDVIRERELLLVLDNCEHIVDPVAELVELLRGAGVRVLATSQVILGLAGEVVWGLEPLEVPTRGADFAAIERAGAVRLFVARARAVGRGFVLDADNAEAVATLCRRLDGLPLALELAATRVRALGVHEVVARLDDRFRLLATGYRGAPTRQQTLTAVLDWSWELLTEPERIVLRRLAIHADGCSLAAAEAVCAAADLPRDDVPGLLVNLVDRSLVTVTHVSGEPRYRLLESIAAYCITRMGDVGELATVTERGRRYYLELAERAAPHLHGPQQQAWLRQLDAESANLRHVLDGFVADGDGEGALRLVDALAWSWFLRGRIAEARRWLRTAIEVGETGELLSQVRAWETGFAFVHGDDTTRESVTLPIPSSEADPGLLRAQWFLVHTGLDVGGIGDTAAQLADLRESFDACGDSWGIAAVRLTECAMAFQRGDMPALERSAQRCMDEFAALGDRWGRLQAAVWLGGFANLTGDWDRAIDLHHTCLRTAEELELWPDVAGCSSWLGWVALGQGDFERSREYCERALALAVEHGLNAVRGYALMCLASGERRTGRLDEAEAHLNSVFGLDPGARDFLPPAYGACVRNELGFIRGVRGDVPESLNLHLAALDLAVSMAAPIIIAHSLDGVAEALARGGRRTAAVQVLGAAEALRELHGIERIPAELSDVDRITATVIGPLRRIEVAAGLKAGRALTPEQARCLAVSTPA